MRIFVKKNTWLPRGNYGFDCGWGNGYVFIPKGHSMYGRDYDDINQYVDVHGRLTFSTEVDSDMINSWSLEPYVLGYWCVGFDTSHYNDRLSDWPQHRVVQETERLRDQLLNL